MKYNRLLLKLSGEALAGQDKSGIDPVIVQHFAQEIKKVVAAGFSLGIVVGGGNIWRGRQAEAIGMDRASADYMGMLGTVINALALGNTLKQLGVESRVMTSMSIPCVAEPYIQNKALAHLDKKRVLVFGGGIGSPYFTTDTTAAIRAAEIKSDLIIMAKFGVNGVYDSDPLINSTAKLYKRMLYSEIITSKLNVIDITAATLCNENNIDMLVINVTELPNLLRIIKFMDTGTLIQSSISK